MDFTDRIYNYIEIEFHMDMIGNKLLVNILKYAKDNAKSIDEFKELLKQLLDGIGLADYEYDEFTAWFEEEH